MFLKGEPSLSQMIRAAGFPEALHVTEMFRPSIASNFFGRPERRVGLTGNEKQFVINMPLHYNSLTIIKVIQVYFKRLYLTT